MIGFLFFFFIKDFLSADSKNSESNERIFHDNSVNFPRVFSNQSSSNDEVSDLPNDILQAIDQYNQCEKLFYDFSILTFPFSRKCRQLIEFQNEIQMKISSHRRTTLQTNCTVSFLFDTFHSSFERNFRTKPVEHFHNIYS